MNPLKTLANPIAAITTLLLLAWTPAPANNLPTLTGEQARAELRSAVALIEQHHPEPFHHTARQDFYACVDAMLARADPRSVARHFFDLSRLLALVFDTHTQIHVTEETPGFDATYPLRFRLFPDGLYIVAAGAAYRDHIGKRVVRIGDRDALEVIAQLTHYAPSENHPRKRVFAEMFLYLPETYTVLGLATSEGVALTLASAPGQVEQIHLDKTWDRGLADFGWETLNPFLPEEFTSLHQARGTQPPLYMSNLHNNYWFTFLEEGRSLYLQLNLPFAKDEGESPMDFHVRWLDALRGSRAETMIIDLRNNPGGSINIGMPIAGILAQQFFEHPTLRGVAVLIGPDTVSAGPILAAQLENAIRPVFIGGPSGSAPNLYLEPVKAVMPYSKLSVEVSREQHISTQESDTRRYIAPDIALENSFEDFMQGWDRLLEAALTVDGKMRRETYAGASPYAPWRRASQRAATGDTAESPPCD